MVIIIPNKERIKTMKNHIRIIISFFVMVTLLFSSSCFKVVQKYADEAIYENETIKKKVSRIVAVTLFTNLSKQPGVEMDLMDKLFITLKNKGANVITPIILKNPKQEIHRDDKVEIISDYYGYQDSLSNILNGNFHWLVTGYIKDSNQKDSYIVTFNTFANTKDQTLAFRTSQIGSIDTIVSKFADKFVEEDNKSPLEETVQTDNKKQVGTKKVYKGEEKELDVLQTVLWTAGFIGITVVSILVVKH